MSESFIGSKIAIITKTQCRYIGTIVGIDQTTSSILLGTVTCFGTEDRPGNIITNQMVGTIVPIMQFANSEIADLQIVDDEYLAKELVRKQNQRSVPVTPVAPTFVQPSIHDDPAIVSAVVNSASKQESSSINSNLSTQMMAAFNQMTLNDGNSKVEGFLLPSDTDPIQSSWPTAIGSSKPDNKDRNQIKSTVETKQNDKSRFFDNFTSKSNETFRSTRENFPQGNSFSNQTMRSNYHHNRFPNGNQQASSRPFYNNHARSGYGSSNLNRRPNGNRETFQTNVNEMGDDFDFESSNRNFQKLTSENDKEQEKPIKTSQIQPVEQNQAAAANDFQPIYDKSRSFFDNSTTTNTTETSKFNRVSNQDTFGSDGYSRRPYRGRIQNFNNRRQNNNQHRQYQHGYNDQFHRQ